MDRRIWRGGLCVLLALLALLWLGSNSSSRAAQPQPPAANSAARPPAGAPPVQGTPTDTATPTPCAGPNVIVNPGFETADFTGWITATVGQAPPPTVDATAHSGQFAANLSASIDSSAIYQQVVVPGSANLAFWYNPAAQSVGSLNVYVTDTNNQVLAAVLTDTSSTGVWTPYSYDLSAFGGQTVRIRFQITATGTLDNFAVPDNYTVHVDDVSLISTICPSVTPTSTATPSDTPTPPSTATATSTMTATSTATAVPSSTVTPHASHTATGTATATATTTHTPVGTWTALPTATPTNTPAPGPIAGGPGAQQAPRLYGNILVWEDNRSGSWDVYLRDISAPLTTPVPVAIGPADARHPAIGDSFIVWQDNRSGFWEIYARAYTGTTLGPEFLVSGGRGDQENPAVAGNTFVWQSDAGFTAASQPGRAAAPTGLGRWEVVGLTLGSLRAPRGRPARSPAAAPLIAGVPITYTSASVVASNPAIDNDTIVWQSTVPTTTQQLPGGLGRWSVDGFDLVANQPFSLTESLAGDQTNPAISGDTVVWQSYTGPAGQAPAGLGRWSVDGIHLATHAVFTVTDSVAGDQTHPAIGGDLVVYQDEQVAAGRPDGLGRWSVEVTNLATGTSRTVSTTGTDATLPAISDGVIAWQQTTVNGDPDVFATVCSENFVDVPPDAYFAAAVTYLGCDQVLSGYADGTFRPYNNMTRGQLAKLLVVALGWAADTTGGPHFSDVPLGSPFYVYVETAYHQGILSGYADGTFRPNSQITRGQLAKLLVGAFGWSLTTTGGPHFVDVPPANPFYAFVETAYAHAVISGYADGTFRPYNTATRGQVAKILYGALATP
ncbi:MAG TPA: S-layer homology domain-containing protein [Chloroflexia bacterium]|nr:S-layer homology domain-containing protein [Chloroflexia bacterium]